MFLYIDPGTGSMLFAVLIGIIGAAAYLVRTWIMKLRFLLSGGKRVESTERIPLAIFSDDKRYWSVFRPVCAELDRRGIDVVYMTASPDDPGLNSGLPHVKGEFIGENNKAFARLNFLSADVLLSTTPGLDVYQWKRSKNVGWYVHMLHAPNTVLGYRMFGTDFYDALLLSGEYQVQDVRALEKLRGLPAKEIVKIGIPYLDEKAARLASDGPIGAHPRTILLAPSWGESAILKRFGEKILTLLLATGYKIIVRPHPQSFQSEAPMLDALMKKFPESDQLEWNRDSDNYQVLRRSDLMISDFSGVIYDYFLVFDKPVIYTDTKVDKSPYDSWWLDTPLWNLETLPHIGKLLSEENLDDLKDLIDTCITSSDFADGRRQARQETWEYQGVGAVRAADYLEAKVKQIQAQAQEKKEAIA